MCEASIGITKCAICDLVIDGRDVDTAIRLMNEHAKQVHPDVQFVHQIDQARAEWLEKRRIDTVRARELIDEYQALWEEYMREWERRGMSRMFRA